MADLYGLSVDDIEDAANPLAETGLGVAGVTEALILGKRNSSADYVSSALPELYRRMLRRVEGEKVVPEASAGQKTFTLMRGLIPRLAAQAVADSLTWTESTYFSDLALYVDFGAGVAGGAPDALGGVSINAPQFRQEFGGSGYTPYSSRTRSDRLPATDYSLDAKTGVVTLAGSYVSGLSEGQVVYADYEHTCTRHCDLLRMIVLTVTLVRLQEEMPYASEAGLAELHRRYQEATAILLAIKDGTMGLDMFDELELWQETRLSDAGATNRLRRWRLL